MAYEMASLSVAGARLDDGGVGVYRSGGERGGESVRLSCDDDDRFTHVDDRLHHQRVHVCVCVRA